MKNDVIKLTQAEYNELAYGITRMAIGVSNGFYVESLNLFVCHYDKDTDSFSVDIELDIPPGAWVAVCFPGTVKERYNLDVLGDWDVLTIIALDKRSLTLTIKPKE